MPDRFINRVNVWGKKKKRDIYNTVINFNDRRKNPYHKYYENYLDGMLDHPKRRETNPIPAKFTGVVFDADEAHRTETDQGVEK